MSSIYKHKCPRCGYTNHNSWQLKRHYNIKKPCVATLVDVPIENLRGVFISGYVAPPIEVLNYRKTMDKYSTSVQFNMDESNWQTEMYQLFKRDFIDTGLVFQHSQDAGYYDTYVREDYTEPVMTYDIITDFISRLTIHGQTRNDMWQYIAYRVDRELTALEYLKNNKIPVRKEIELTPENIGDILRSHFEINDESWADKHTFYLDLHRVFIRNIRTNPKYTETDPQKMYYVSELNDKLYDYAGKIVGFRDFMYAEEETPADCQYKNVIMNPYSFKPYYSYILEDTFKICNQHKFKDTRPPNGTYNTHVFEDGKYILNWQVEESMNWDY